MIVDDLQRLICEERFAELVTMLPGLTHYPSEQVRECLRSALIAARARRAHYVEELRTVEHQRAYLNSLRDSNAPALDFTG